MAAKGTAPLATAISCRRPCFLCSSKRNARQNSNSVDEVSCKTTLAPKWQKFQCTTRRVCEFSVANMMVATGDKDDASSEMYPSPEEGSGTTTCVPFIGTYHCIRFYRRYGRHFFSSVAGFSCKTTLAPKWQKFQGTMTCMLVRRDVEDDGNSGDEPLSPSAGNAAAVTHCAFIRSFTWFCKKDELQPSPETGLGKVAMVTRSAFIGSVRKEMVFGSLHGHSCSSGDQVSVSRIRLC